MRRRYWGGAPRGGLYPRLFGILPAGSGHEHDRPKDTPATARAVLLYLYAVRLALRSPFWPEPHPVCELVRGLLATGDLTLFEPCRCLVCPDCQVGHIGRLGLPVLYARELPAVPSYTCGLTCPDGASQAAIGARWGLSKQRIQQIEVIARRRAHRVEAGWSALAQLARR